MKMRFVVLALFVCICFLDTNLASSRICQPGYFLCKDQRNCIERHKWCDGHRDCSDKSDEEYCTARRRGYTACPNDLFECDNRKCIPLGGLCDGFNSCGDDSDEANCAPKINETEVELLRNATVKATNWLLDSEDGEFGWNEHTQRAFVTLFLADPDTFKDNDHSLLLAKQLELRFAWDLINNATSPMSLFTMSLYVNAFLATCKDPSNYYGIDLSEMLRLRTNAEQALTGFISPSVYLTLCLTGKSTKSDLEKMNEIFTSPDAKLGKLGLQSLAYLAISCIERLYDFPNSTTIRDEALAKLAAKADKFGDIYSTALIFQAMANANKTEKDWKRNEALTFILQNQEENGSFGDFLATYYVMPVITGKSLEILKNGCNKTLSKNMTNFLKTSKAAKITIEYSLYIGGDVDMRHTIQMKIPETTSFFDLMKMAEKENPKFKFKSEIMSQSYPTIYSIGGIPNDAEKGMFWNLYTVSTKGLKMEEKVELQPYSGDLRNLKLKDGNQVIFWYKQI